MIVIHHAIGEVRGLEDGEGDEALVDVLEGHGEPPRRECGHGHGRALVLPLDDWRWGWWVWRGVDSPDRGRHTATANAT